MYKKHQKCVILFIFICVGMIFFCGEDSGALTVGIRLVPNRTNIPVDFEHISLTADVIPPSTITYQWNLYGPGAFDGSQTEQSIVYIPPKKIIGKLVEATITVTVINKMGQKDTESVTFTISSLPPTPTPTPPPTPPPTPKPVMSKTTKVAIGVGAAAAAVGVGIYILTRDDDDNNDCKDEEGEYKNDEDYPYPAEYSGKVWIKIVRRCKGLDDIHYYKIHWGPWVCENQLPLGKWKSVTLMFTKDVDIGEPTPLHFHIDPPCLITFGKGEPSAPLDDELIIDLSNDSCWQQT